MIIQNLRLSLKEKNDEKIILATENGMEFSLPASLLDKLTEDDQALYLSLDYHPTPTVEDKKKEVLNDLLGNE
ncbi:hypothetical protein HOD19_03180 [bacterium]|jgi:hypothetical protein|nr:hypothetical protein [bacterium]MBT4649216.1 hypothetical protein [bacterium]